jgi:hypothetical protein
METLVGSLASASEDGADCDDQFRSKKFNWICLNFNF